MTESEAIKELHKIRPAGAIIPQRRAIALDMAISVLSKQVPKKIMHQKQSYGTPYRCPECEAGQTPIDFFNSDGTEPSEKYSWCWHCGEKLDWSEESEDNNETD